MCPTRAAALGASIALSLLLVSSTAHAAASQNDSDAGGASATAATVAAAAAGAAEVLPPGDQAQQDLLKWALANSDPESLRRAAEEARDAQGTPAFAERQARLNALLDHLRSAPSEEELMQEAITTLTNASSTAEQLAHALLTLQEMVESIDNANNLQTMGGLEPVVALLGAEHPPALQARACQVLATASSNNEAFQGQLLEGHPQALPRLMALVNAASAGSTAADSAGGAGGAADAGSAALLALSHVLRLNAAARRAFYAAAGVHTLQGLLGDGGGEPSLRRRALGLLTDLITLDAPAMSAAAAAASPQAAAGLDFPAAVTAALRLLEAEQRRGADADVDLAERALLALSALLGEGEGDAASGAAAAETIAGLGGLATLQGLHAVLHRAAQAEAEEGSYAADVAAMALRVHECFSKPLPDAPQLWACCLAHKRESLYSILKDLPYRQSKRDAAVQRR
ncbi:nucleotide exchange factor SIL1 [Micractinium conductrix]|uniref:Nucleotide exchange factor SIL1 n=1 Tax=Micractinium conductrix TaxID=554055 RepID=A0A2P6VRP0_9CHLO|nr:nucleotide exchange factor SIL1 [Micractinium conductrix]|eukprot:PSC76763.1 nucleotide exchange factor SIL1 [Micractinium conductrix]